MSARMRTRSAAVTGAALAATLLAVAVSLAVDVEGWSGAIRDGDLQQAAGDSRPDAWDYDAHVPGDVAERLLGLGDDLRFRRAVALFSLMRPDVGALSPDDVASARERALRELIVTATDRDQETRAAQAANLAGILAAESPAGGASDISPAESAAESFRASITLDPGSEHAKLNLERLLRTLRSERRAEGPTRDRGRLGRSRGGAGLSPPGEGY